VTKPLPTRAALIGLVAALALLACGDDPEGQVQVAGPELMQMGADQVLIGLTHNMTREGVLQGELRADTAYLYNDDSTVRLRVVDVTFYDDQGRPDSRLTADSGRYDLQTGDMAAHGGVVVRDTADSERLETEQLLYDALSNELRTDTAFVWHRGDDVIRGTGLVTDPSLDDVRIERPAGTSPGTGGP
jgi:LPS export ABC transporter protein LptC